MLRDTVRDPCVLNGIADNNGYADQTERGTEMDKKKVINTTRATRENPLEFLARAFVDGTSEAIMGQEAEGQQSFVTSTTLPTRIQTENGKEIMESWGFVFGDVVENDDIFQYAALPEGWSKKPTEHSMWSELIDEQGRKRGSVFYKAAFYDRSAHMGLSRRYSYTQNYEAQETDNARVGTVTDLGVTIYETEPLPYKDKNGEEIWDNYDKVNAMAVAWLDEHYPDWKDPTAYWSA